MRKIGAPLALVNGKIEKNCIIHIDEVSKKIGTIASNVSDMDSVASLEYFNGLLLPVVTGWENPMTATKRKELVKAMNMDNLCAFTPEPLRDGYTGDILLLEKLDIRNKTFTSSTIIRKV